MGTALTFGAIVKVISVPAYVWRQQVSWRVLKLLLFGGVPGVLTRSFLLGSLREWPLPEHIVCTVGHFDRFRQQPSISIEH